MNTNSKYVVAALAVVLAGGLAYNQLSKSELNNMAGMDHSAVTSATASESTKGFETAMATMMNNMMTPMSGKPDLDFVQGMMPHHQGAIDMAKVVLQYGKDPAIKTLAEGVIKAQEGEIAFMKDWLAKTDQATLPVVADSTKANEQAMAVMMKNMAGSYSGNADVDFVKGMIPHHQGAIDMAKVAQQFVKDPALLKLAGDIVGAQTSEITFMNEWLRKNGG
jgi:uncharacterized protein (DUF305 family)